MILCVFSRPTMREPLLKVLEEQIAQRRRSSLMFSTSITGQLGYAFMLTG